MESYLFFTSVGMGLADLSIKHQAVFPEAFKLQRTNEFSFLFFCFTFLSVLDLVVLAIK